MSEMIKNLVLVLAAVSAILVAGAAVSGCDNSNPENQPIGPNNGIL